ncbi:MAG: Dabb family protein [Sedimentisphaerales bacterium]|nr:Dabb family protein [Sedimentisphaerales bacterium]
MIRSLLFLAATCALLGGCVNVQETQRVCEEEECVVTGTSTPVQVLRHVVLFKFKEGTSAAEIREIENAFCALPTKIATIHDFEWGTDVSVENRHKGFTHCFVVTFRSEADRGVYIPHPAHKEFGALLGPHLDDVLVVDYWAN